MALNESPRHGDDGASTHERAARGARGRIDDAKGFASHVNASTKHKDMPNSASALQKVEKR